MENRKERLKDLIRSLHEGVDPEEAKSRFKDLLQDATPMEIAVVEEELIREGMPREEIHRLCDVHLAVFRESLESEGPAAAAGHPIHILVKEHEALLRLAGDLARLAQEMRRARRSNEQLGQLTQIKEHLQGSESHYVREENVLFPYVEKHGITQPPAIMWMEHDRIRAVKKSLYALIEASADMEWQEFTRQLAEASVAVNELLHDHFQKENRILFPTALRVITEEEWVEARRQFDELGYCPFTPQEARISFRESATPVPESEAAADVVFETGTFAKDELEALLNTLPVEITFVDREDSVRYFNQTKERIFPRTKAAIGRKVQLCHPQRSVHLVNRILEDFRNGRRDVAEFWIQMENVFVHIRYLAVRNPKGEYLGTLEVVQDAARIRSLEGERRLLDEAE